MKKKLRENLLKVFAKLGFTDRGKDPKNEFTAEENAKINATYKELFGTDLAEDIAAAEDEAKVAENNRKIMTILSIETEDSSDDAGGEGEGTDDGDNADGENNNAEDNAQSVPTSAQIMDAATKVVEENKSLKDKLNKMGAQAQVDQPETVVGTTLSINGPGTNKDHLFGIPSDFFSMKNRWNKVTANKSYASENPVNENVDGPAFRQAASAFGSSLAQRYAYLKENNLLDPQKLSEGYGVSYTGLANAGLGDQYMVRRQDALIARILTLRQVTDLFPVRYGVQDRELITNAFFTEVSQAWQGGEVWKGDMSLEPEFGYVDDAMVKVLFGPMKEIERKYIAYLNTDNSDPIKWSMIEFALLGIYQQMQTEQNKRRIMGIYVKPDSGVAGSFLNASTGIIYTLIRYYHENKILLHDDANFVYTDATMLAAVQELCADILASISEDTDLSGYALYLNANHKSWWIKNIRAAYGKETDFNGPNGYLNVIPDTEIPIKWVPNMGNLKLMFVQTPGNLQFLEFAPGEMLNVSMEQLMEQVRAWAVWKEGTSASFVGRSFSTKEALVANNYKLQQIFMNKPSVTLVDKATTADATTGFWFVTSDNTAATALTDVTGKAKGVAYILECGGVTNATTISKAGNFDQITANYTPTAVGDYIMVILNKDNKFIELERCVGGVRTINKEVQPNTMGNGGR